MAHEEDSILGKFRSVKMPDGSTWGVPVRIIAENRAVHYAYEFGGDVERSLREDTLPLFAEEEFEIHDWASNNMNWSDVKEHAVKLEEPEPMDDDRFQEGWIIGDRDIVDAPASNGEE